MSVRASVVMAIPLTRNFHVSYHWHTDEAGGGFGMGEVRHEGPADGAAIRGWCLTLAADIVQRRGLDQHGVDPGEQVSVVAIAFTELEAPPRPRPGSN